MTPQKREEDKKRQCPEVTSSLWASPPPWNSPRVLFPQPHLPASFFSSFSVFSCRWAFLGPSVGKGNRPMFFVKDEQLFGKKEILLKASLWEDLLLPPAFPFPLFVLLGEKGRRKSKGKKASSLFWFNNLDLRGGGKKGLCHHLRNKEQSETPQKRFGNNYKRALNPTKCEKKITCGIQRPPRSKIGKDSFISRRRSRISGIKTRENPFKSCPQFRVSPKSPLLFFPIGYSQERKEMIKVLDNNATEAKFPKIRSNVLSSYTAVVQSKKKPSSFPQSFFKKILPFLRQIALRCRGLVFIIFDGLDDFW